MTLLDQYGREIKSNKPILNEVAVQTVRDRYTSYPSQGLTPGRLAAILKEADQGLVLRQAELAEEIEEKDGHLGSLLQTRKLSVAGLSWEVLPADDSAPEKKKAEAAKEMLEYIGSTDPHDEGLEGGMIDTLDGIFKGFAVQEIMWEIVSGKVYAKSLEWVHQKRFTFSGPPQSAIGNPQFASGFMPLLQVPRLLTDAEPVWGEDLLPNKFIFHRHKARSGATSRGGLLRAAAYMYLFKNYDVKDWLIFNELFSVPMRVGKYKTGASPDEIEKLKQAVFNLGVDAAAVISESTMIELLESKLRGDVSAFEKFHEMCEKTQTKIVLGHSSASDSTPGKLGGEQQGQDLRQDLLESDAKQIERVYRFQLLGPWTIYNYGPGAPVPKLKLHYEAEEDLEKTAKVYGILVKDMGFEGIPVSHVHERFSIPQPQNGEETLKAPAPQSPFGAVASPPVGEVGEGAVPQQNKLCSCGAQHHSRIPASTHPRIDDVDLQLHAAGMEWTAAYLDRIRPMMQSANKDAVAAVESWIQSLSSPPAQEEFAAHVASIMGNAYAAMNTKEIGAVVAEMYAWYKNAQVLTPGVQALFGGPDMQASSFLGELDTLYFSKFVKNADASAALKQFLDERYLKSGEGLFGRGDPNTIVELKDLLSQKMTDISGYQAQRIVDTSVQRVRNWSRISNFADAGVPEIEIIEPTQDCPFCVAMHGRVIQVPQAAALVRDLSSMQPEEYEAWIKESHNAPVNDNIENFVARGVLPPYHPNCHGTTVKRMSK